MDKLLTGLRFLPGQTQPDPVHFALDSISAFIAEQSGPTCIVLSESSLQKLLDGKADGLVLANPGAGGKQGTASTLDGYLCARALPNAIFSKYKSGRTCGSKVGNFINGKGRQRDAVYFIAVVEKAYRQMQGTEPPAPKDEKDPRIAKIFDRFAGLSPAMARVRYMIYKVVCNGPNVRVLILGESGTGKEVVAQLIHDLTREGQKFTAMNCAAIPSGLAESVLFGHVKGAFTGAHEYRPGLWEQAGAGTLFLDEIGDMSLESQARILRSLEKKTIRPVGATSEVDVEARVLAATNRDLRSMVTFGTFRDDLLGRLQVFEIKLPSLRDYPEDIGFHARRIWRKKDLGDLPEEVVDVLSSWTFPGNVRELENTLEFLSVMCGAEAPTAQHVIDYAPEKFGRTPEDSSNSPRTKDRVPENLDAVTQRVQEEAERYRALQSDQELLAQILRGALERMASRYRLLPIIQTRARTVVSVTETLARMESERTPDLRVIRDLCRARLIVQTPGQVRHVCMAIQRYFTVVERTNDALGSTVRPWKCEHQSFTYIVRLDEQTATALARAFDIELPSRLLDLEAKIEIQTELEHTWAGVQAQMGGRTNLPMPQEWIQKFIDIDDALTAVDRGFEEIRSDVETYMTSFGQHVTSEEAEIEIKILELVARVEPGNPRTAYRIAKMAVVLGDWARAIRTLEPHVGSGYQPVVRDLGVALCKYHDPSSPEFMRGLALLEDACLAEPRDPDAQASMAGAWKRCGDLERANVHYAIGHRIDNGDPYALGGYLDTSLALSPEVDFVALKRQEIDLAIERCCRHAEAGVNLPWAHFNHAKFLLLRDQTLESLRMFGQGFDTSTSPWMVETILGSIDLLIRTRPGTCGDAAVRRLLALGWNLHFASQEGAARLSESAVPGRDISGRVVLLVGDSECLDGDPDTLLARRLATGLRSYAGKIITVGAGRGMNALIDQVREESFGDVDWLDYPVPDVDAGEDCADSPDRKKALFEAGLGAQVNAWVDVFSSRDDASDTFILGLRPDFAESWERIWGEAFGSRVARVAGSEEPVTGLTRRSRPGDLRVVQHAGELESLLAVG